MSQGLKLAFVFDGIVPELKNAERQRRKNLKLEAQKLYEAQSQTYSLIQLQVSKRLKRASTALSGAVQLERVPAERMTETCKRFTMKLLLTNRQRLLE